MTARLFDVDAKAHRQRTGCALVYVDTAACPACGARTVPVTADQPALLRHGGYGATMHTVTLPCGAWACAAAGRSSASAARSTRGPR